MVENTLDKNNNVVKGAVTLAISALAVKVLGLIYKIPLAHIVGDEGMGYFNSAYTVYSFFYLICTSGLPKALTIYISEKQQTESEYKTFMIVRKCLLLFGFVSLFFTVVFTLGAKQISGAIGNSGAYYSMVIIAPSIFFVMLSGIMRGYFNGVLNLLPIAVSQVIEGVSKLALGLAFAMYARSINSPLPVISAYTILGITVGSFFSCIYLYITLKNNISKHRLGQRVIYKAEHGALRRIVKLAVPLTVSAAIMSASNILDLGLVMKGLLSLGYSERESAALFGNYTTMAVPMYNLVLSLLTPITVAILPVLRANAVRGDIRSYSSTLDHSMKLSSFLGMPATMMLYFFSRDILILIFPDESAIIASPLLSLTALGILPAVWTVIANTATEATGRIKAPLISMSFGCIVKLLITYILINNINFGILGAPIGSLISHFATLIVSVLLVRSASGVRMKIVSCSFFPLINSLISVISVLLLFGNRLEQDHSSFLILVMLFTCGIIYIFLSIITRTIPKEVLKNVNLHKSID